MKRLTFITVMLAACTLVQAQRATVKLDATTPHQRITGFGGFVCSPQFTYNHMTNAEIKKVWGESSTVGCNIMRLYIPIGKNAWSQSLATAKLAKQMGLIVFASPWGQPKEWKTNNSSDATNSNGERGKLKKENWPDYAQYLEDYVQYLRNNGVELDAISIQNEPDWAASYAGCLWDASEIASFVKTYGRSISCKIMAPESIGCSDSYANALNKTGILDCFDIYGGHQYGGIGSAYKNLGKKGKEVWMTEYLINWNEAEGNTRNFDFSKDFFNFFRAINTCMLGDFNAWIHYAAKRYYAMMSDGQRGTGTSGSITKRGYIMAHFAKFVTGMTRIDASFAGGLEGSAYLSQTGDTVVAVIANTTDKDVEVTLDLPFYTDGTTTVTTSKTKNFNSVQTQADEETFRPVTNISAQSVVTVMAIKTRDRQVSDMTASMAHFDRIDDMTPTKTSFGTTYKLSGKQKTFDSSNPLISSRKNTASGYLALNDRYSQLVMHINKVTTTSSLTAGKPTLYYVNAQGQAANHEYDRLDLNAGQDFDLVFDLSPATLQDGCIGLLSLTCDNTQSHLTINFGDVYFGSDYAATLSGAYVADDSNVIDYSADAACTSLDLTAVTDLPDNLPWLAGTNRVVYVAEGSSVGSLSNVVAGETCNSLVLTADGGDFRPATPFTATTASMTCTVDGMRLLILPFNAVIPAGAKAFVFDDKLSLVQMRSIPANRPVLVEGRGELTFSGSGDIAFYRSPLTDSIRGTFTAMPLFAGDYIFGQNDGQWGFVRLTAASTLEPFGVYMQHTGSEPFLSLDPSSTGIDAALMDNGERMRSNPIIYDLQGRLVKQGNHKHQTSNFKLQSSNFKLQKGVYIKDGRKIVVR